MAEATKRSDGQGPPDPEDEKAFHEWLARQPREWSIAIAVRSTLRVLPLISADDPLLAVVLPAFRATAIARFAAKYPNGSIDTTSAARSAYDAASSAYTATRSLNTGARSLSSAFLAVAAIASSAFAASAVSVNAPTSIASATSAADTSYAAAAAASGASGASAALRRDAQGLYDGTTTASQLANSLLWPNDPPRLIGGAWQGLARELRASGNHWLVWIGWYESVLAGAPASEADDAAFTDIPGKLPWDQGAEAVNTEIARRLATLHVSSELPNQSPAPVRVEERDGRVSKSSDSESELASSKRDFAAWRDPVVDHIEELTASDFAIGTNHSRVRDRLVALDKLLPGEIAEVKDRQFRIGYEIERFDGLMVAYRTGGDDMPVLNAAQLEDLDRLRAALKMGIDKLERWSEFRKQANESTAGEAGADREVVGDALDEMAAAMEQQSIYFDPELPATFRFLSEAVRDPRGATKTVVYGAVKSAENLVSFLGQRALGVGKRTADEAETRISKAAATVLITTLGGAALQISGALPHAWAWLKPLLTALGMLS